MTPQSSCKYNGHGFDDDGVCIYCHEDDGTQTKASDEMTQPNQSELDDNIEMLLLRAYNGEYDRSASQTLADVKKRIVSLITANYTDKNDYVMLEAEMELLKYKLRKTEENTTERERMARISEGQLFREAMIKHSTPAIYWCDRLDELTKDKL